MRLEDRLKSERESPGRYDDYTSLLQDAGEALEELLRAARKTATYCGAMHPRCGICDSCKLAAALVLCDSIP